MKVSPAEFRVGFADYGREILMAGIKRSRAEMESNESADNVSPFIPMFEGFKAEHHDRRERVIKASRDITAYSKKVVFALQR